MRKIKRAIAKNLSTQNEPLPSQHVVGSLGPGAYLSPSHAEDTLVLDATACANKDVLSLTRTRNKTSPAVTLETLVDRVVSEEPDARMSAVSITSTLQSTSFSSSPRRIPEHGRSQSAHRREGSHPLGHETASGASLTQRERDRFLHLRKNSSPQPLPNAAASSWAPINLFKRSPRQRHQHTSSAPSIPLPPSAPAISAKHKSGTFRPPTFNNTTPPWLSRKAAQSQRILRPPSVSMGPTASMLGPNAQTLIQRGKFSLKCQQASNKLVRYTLSNDDSSGVISWPYLAALAAAVALAQQIFRPYWAALLALLLASSVWSSFRIQSESITAIRDFGIQVETARVNGLKQVRSIEKSQIRDIVILEAMHCYSFRFVLAVIVKGSSKSVLVFPNIYPGLELLLPVYRGMHMVLGMDRGLARRIKQQESGEALDGMEDAPKYDRKSCEQHS